MMKFLHKLTLTLIISLLVLTGSILAQTGDTLPKSPWTPSGMVGLNISQIAFSDWSQGGENSIAWSLIGNFGLQFEESNWRLINQMKLAYGMNKLGDADFRITDNELYIESVLSKNIGWMVDPFFSNTIRTVITDGYDYSSTPKQKISSFFDPGYVTQSLGFTYGQEKAFKTRLGFAVQETFANEFREKYTDDPTTPEIEAFKIETGIESVTETEFTIDENVLYQSNLRLFTRFNSLDVWDVRWDNLITAKISKYFNVNLNVLIIYEKQQSLRTQIKQALQLGITYNLF